MSQIYQLSLFIENRPGALSAVCRVLRENNISISTLALADTSQFGILRLLVKEYDAAKVALEKAGFTAKVTEVLALEVPDRPGGLADLLELFDQEQMQVEYMYAFTFGVEDQAVMVFRFDDQERAVAALEGKAVKRLSAEELFK